MSEQSVVQPADAPGGVRGEQLRGIARTRCERWIGSVASSGAAARTRGGAAVARQLVEGKVEALLAARCPADAARRWLLDAIAAWAPLAVVFLPRAPVTQLPGVSGVLSVHAQEVLEKEYAHVIASAPSPGRAIELLAAEAQQLELQIEIAEAANRLFRDDDAADPQDWIGPFRDMSLAMAEYLHRQALGIEQRLSDAVAMSYSTQIARVRRDGRPAPLRQRGA